MLDTNFETRLRKFILGLGSVESDTKRLEKHEVFRAAGDSDPDQRIFAIIKTGSRPLVVEMMSDWQLSLSLRDKYESILPSKLMSPVTWNKIICSGQISEDDIFDLARLAYELVQKQVTE